MQKKKCTAIVLAAGQGKRMGTKVQKQYLEIEGKPILYYSLHTFEQSSVIDEVVLVVGENQVEYCKDEIVSKYGISKVKKIVQGGAERYHSVWNGLQEVDDDCYVFIHDGARPFVDEEILINDTNGGIVYRNVDDDLNRRNYRQADNINYLDGDYASSIYNPNDNTSITKWTSDYSEEEEVEEEATDYLANPDSVTNMMYRRHSGNRSTITSLLNNKVRVVKGGSWNDRIYWMQPGTRRFYDQDRSTSWIGFRCAMDRLGSQR